MSTKRRNALILVLVGALIAAAIAIIATKPTKLGLDLKGGVQLVYQGRGTPQQPKVTPDALNRAIDIIRQRVNQLGVSEAQIRRSSSDQITVSLPNVTDVNRAEKQVGTPAQLAFFDWEESVIGPNGKPDPRSGAVTGDPQAPGTGGGALPLYQAVKRASKRSPMKAKNNTRLGPAYYLFGAKHHKLAGPDETRGELREDAPGHRIPPGSQVLTVPQGTLVVQAVKPKNPPKGFTPKYYVMDDDPGLLGKDVKDPKQTFDNGPGGTGEPIVSFDFDSKGKQQFHNITRRLAQRGQRQTIGIGASAQQNFQHFAVVLDRKLISVPYIDFTQYPDGIDASNGADIQGSFTIQSAQDLANLLKLGALPISLKLISESQVSATLGQQALNQGLVAGAAGFALVLLFLLGYYRVLGIVASLALLVYAGYFFALIKLIPITLSLPGMAGLILTIGVAADANIVIFERVKEEVRAGANAARAVRQGYKKGLSAVIDANVVTLLTAFILFVLATAGVQGFALTLGIGTIVSLFTAVLATQAALGNLGSTRLLRGKARMGAAKRRFSWSSFDFMGKSKWFFCLSGVILLAGALGVGARGLNFGIDFESGTQATVALHQGPQVSQVRSTLSNAGIQDPEVQRVSNQKLGRNVYEISTRKLEPKGVQKLRTSLRQSYGLAKPPQVTSVGPTFGQTVANSAIVAIIASLAIICVYIAVRFEWKFAVPVLIELMHDLLITTGIYALTGREVTTSTVAALLTILGYSLYDTIIVFDRVRENVPRMPRAAFSQVVNRSMSEVLTRSLATSGCTLLPVVMLLIFGGATLQDFAFALLVGVLSGAYSSIFIGAPVLTHWKEREPVYRRRLAAITAKLGYVPAYATSVDRQPVDVEPETGPERARKGQEGWSSAPLEAQGVSASEFERMKEDIADEMDSPGAVRPGAVATRARPSSQTSTRRGGGASRRTQGAPAPKGSERSDTEQGASRARPGASEPTEEGNGAEPEPHHAPDADPDSLAAEAPRQKPKSKSKSSRRSSNKRAGRKR